jgi:hypothetical protein
MVQHDNQSQFRTVQHLDIQGGFGGRGIKRCVVGTLSEVVTS